ncbi:hypothetical protein D4R75_02095 [bacterium]|nr:MAG: hypothetical protein D4R75_02095 [bacterium]
MNFISDSRNSPRPREGRGFEIENQFGLLQSCAGEENIFTKQGKNRSLPTGVPRIRLRALPPVGFFFQIAGGALACAIPCARAPAMFLTPFELAIFDPE